MASETEEATSVGACQQREWRRQRRASLREFCAGCGTIFTPARADVKYCGLACKQATYRQRKIAKAAASRKIDDWAAALIG